MSDWRPCSLARTRLPPIVAAARTCTLISAYCNSALFCHNKAHNADLAQVRCCERATLQVTFLLAVQYSACSAVLLLAVQDVFKLQGPEVACESYIKSMAAQRANAQTWNCSKRTNCYCCNAVLQHDATRKVSDNIATKHARYADCKLLISARQTTCTISRW